MGHRHRDDAIDEDLTIQPGLCDMVFQVLCTFVHVACWCSGQMYMTTNNL